MCPTVYTFHWLPCVMRILQDQLIYMFPQFIDGADFGLGQLKALDLGLGGSLFL